jgi:hypothetical protein
MAGFYCDKFNKNNNKRVISLFKSLVAIPLKW